MRIERIVSTGQASPPGFWYDQPDDEFVVLLTGAARLRFEEGDVTLDMKPGDWVEIPAHVRHRVECDAGRPADGVAGGAYVSWPSRTARFQRALSAWTRAVRRRTNAAAAARVPSVRRSAGRRASSGGDSGP